MLIFFGSIQEYGCTQFLNLETYLAIWISDLIAPSARTLRSHAEIIDLCFAGWQYSNLQDTYNNNLCPRLLLVKGEAAVSALHQQRTPSVSKNH